MSRQTIKDGKPTEYASPKIHRRTLFWTKGTTQAMQLVTDIDATEADIKAEFGEACRPRQMGPIFWTVELDNCTVENQANDQ